MMILKNKLCGSAARLGRGFQTRPFYSGIRSDISIEYQTYRLNHLGYINFVKIYIKMIFRYYINMRPQGFFGAWEKGYLFSGSWGPLVIIFWELGSKRIVFFWIYGALPKS